MPRPMPSVEVGDTCRRGEQIGGAVVIVVMDGHRGDEPALPRVSSSVAQTGRETFEIDAGMARNSSSACEQSFGGE